MTPEFALFNSTEVFLHDVSLPFLRVRSETPLGEAPQTLQLTLLSQSYRVTAQPIKRLQDGSVWVRLLDGGVSGEVLEHRFLESQRAGEENERRHSGRVKTVMSVRSPDLPYARGTTHDVSQSGVRLVTEKPVKVGTVLRLEIQGATDSHDVHPVYVNGEAVWSRQQLNSLFHVGVKLNFEQTV